MPGPADELAAVLDGVIRPDGIGGLEALTLFRDVLMHACRPMDSPLHLAYVATAPTPAANMFDLVVSASSIFGGLWEGGAGAIAAENQALAWLAGLAGFPDGRRRLLRQRRLGGQPLGAGDGPPPRP